MEFDRYRQLVGGRFAAQQMTPMGAALYYDCLLYTSRCV